MAATALAVVLTFREALKRKPRIVVPATIVAVSVAGAVLGAPAVAAAGIGAFAGYGAQLLVRHVVSPKVKHATKGLDHREAHAKVIRHARSFESNLG